MSIRFVDYPEPEQKHNLFAIGTRVTFEMAGDIVKQIIHIPVQYA